MEAGEKEEEETLQTAFKKLRVDAETSLPGTVNVCEALVPRTAPRACTETSGAKPKLGCSKDPWHGCSRKTSRGVSRSQRRRRSKSPILHPPKFTYCSPSSCASSSTSLSPPGGCLKHQRLADPEPLQQPSPGPSALAPPPSAQTQLPSPSSPSALASPPVFGACSGGPAAPASSSSSSGEASGSEAQQEGGTAPGSGPSDFHTLSQLHSGEPAGVTGSATPPCSSCRRGEAPEGDAVAERHPGGSGCLCRSAAGNTPVPLPAGWQGLEVYSFTGLRDVITECEGSLPGPRTASSSALGTAAAVSSSALASGSPRSCSEQVRAYVDDITIEDLSGYMEYFLYIPKKMSHMAEMMYT
ncbi:hypothetical protein NHX12_030251 [Muraenolepis orangiensis]|uniref:Oxidative stress-responsive serine-rich protein 1 n=1 Tax=Muraenolepis orangiensis TaxID=630683 RepID=A0A9Q0E7E6_9TELE|nr:hypothetical protein NHX12_030251 [Muraenolepis orangiensis]